MNASVQQVLRLPDARVRLVLTLGFALSVITLESWSALLLALLLAVALMWLAQLSLASVLKSLLALEGIMLLTLATLPFTYSDAPGLTLSREGVEQAMRILARVNAIVCASLALLASLDPARLGHALNALGMPQALVRVLLFALRYLDVLRREQARLHNAMRARAWRVRFDAHGLRSLGYLVGMMMIRALERAERISAAMRCRAYRGQWHTLEELRLETRDRVWMVTGLGLLGALLGLDIIETQ